MTASIMRKALILILIVMAIVLGLIRMSYVQSGAFPDITDAPLLPSTEMELVAELPMPPGNIAVSDQGQVFFTFHPEAGPDINLAKLIDGEVKAFPTQEWQPGGSDPLAFNEILSLRIDTQQRLWILDNGKHGLKKVRLMAFNIESGELLHRYEFDRELFALGSHANDFQVSADGRFIYISDASFFAQRPALVIYDVENEVAIRRLDSHASVLAGPFEPVVQGRAMTVFGLVTINPGVDGIALDEANGWLYFASISADQLYRLPVVALNDFSLAEHALAEQVEAFAEKTMTDGMAVDEQGNIYLSDLEHSAIVRMDTTGDMQTLLKSASIRWPDGFSWGPEGHLYFTCSSLHQVIGLSPENVVAQAPYQIYRFKPPLVAEAEIDQ